MFDTTLGIKSPSRGNLIGFCVAAALIGMAFIRFPVPDGSFRAMFRMIAESVVLFSIAGVVAYRVNLWVGAFMALVVASWAFQVHHGRVSYLARDYFLIMSAWLVFVWWAVRQGGNVSEWIMNAIAVIALLNVFFLAFQWFGSTWAGMINCSEMKHPIGLMANKNETGALIAMAFPAFCRKRWVYLLPAVIVGLVLARTSTPVLAVGAGLVVWAGIKGHRFFPLLALLLGMILYIELWDSEYLFLDTVQARLDIWLLGYDKFFYHPLFGAGIGHWPLATNQLHAHNDFWQLTFEMGVLVPVIAIGYAVNVMRRFSQEAVLPLIGVVIVAVCSFFSFTAHVATTAIVAATWMALLENSLPSLKDIRARVSGPTRKDGPPPAVLPGSSFV